MLKAILFDLDDTLLDWSACQIDWQDAYQHHMASVYHYVAANNGHRPLVDVDTFLELAWGIVIDRWTNGQRNFIAPNVADILLEVFEQVDVPREELSLPHLMEAYGWRAFPRVSTFPDVYEVLPLLKYYGLKLGLVTNAAQPIEIRDRELEAFNIRQYLDDYGRVTAADVGYLKPHPAIFKRALDHLNVRPDEVVFVGDSVEADIVGAQNLAMKAVVRRIPERLSQMQLIEIGEVEPDGVIDTLHDLLPYLDEWFPDWRGEA